MVIIFIRFVVTAGRFFCYTSTYQSLMVFAYLVFFRTRGSVKNDPPAKNIRVFSWNIQGKFPIFAPQLKNLSQLVKHK